MWQGPRQHRLYAFAWVPPIALACILLSSRGIVVVDFLHDAFIAFDLSWRSAQGQVPHLDFHTPIGQAYSWPFALLARFGDARVSTLLRADVLVAAFVLILSFSSLKRRLSPLFFGLTAMAIATIAMTPRSYMGEGWIDSYTFLAPYNAWGWAVLLPAALIAMIPPEGSPRLRFDVLDGVVLGVLLASLYYLKMTYAAVAIVFMAAGRLLRHSRTTVLVSAASTVVLVALAIESVFHNNLAYWHDLQMASRVNLAAASRLNKLGYELALSAAVGGLFMAVLGLWDRPVQLGRWLSKWWRTIAVVFVLLAGGAIIATQNYTRFRAAISPRLVLQIQATLLCGALVAGGELARRRLRRSGSSDAGAEPSSSWRSGLGWTVLVATAMGVPLLDAATIVGHSLESRSDRVRPIGTLSALAPELLVSATPLTERRELRSSQGEQALNTAYYLQQIQEAVALLEANGAGTGVILAEDFSNPYPMLFRGPSPRGALLWWHLNRSYSERYFPPTEPMLNSATVILESKSEEYGAPIRKICNAQMVRDFRVVDESPLWRLWMRRSG